MKKIFLFLTIFAIIILNTFPTTINALNQTFIYAVTKQDDSFDEFITENFDTILVFQNGYNSLTLMDGIKIYGTTNEQYIYLVMNGNKVTSSFVVTKISNQFFIDYSECFSSILNNLVGISNNDAPLYIYKDNGDLYFSVGATTYCAKTGNYSNVSSLQNNTAYCLDDTPTLLRTIDSFSNTERNRSITSYYQWANYYIGDPLACFCGPITMYNIYRNLGYSTYGSYSDYKAHMISSYSSYYGTNPHLGLTNYATMYNFLVADGYNIRMHSSSGRMTESQMITAIYAHHRYAMCFLNGENGDHIAAIVGISIENTGSVLSVFDPHSGIHVTTSANFSLITNNDTYLWGGGYLADFD